MESRVEMTLFRFLARPAAAMDVKLQGRTTKRKRSARFATSDHVEGMIYLGEERKKKSPLVA